MYFVRWCIFSLLSLSFRPVFLSERKDRFAREDNAKVVSKRNVGERSRYVRNYDKRNRMKYIKKFFL